MMQSYGWNLQRLQHSRNYNSTPVCRTLGRRPEALVLLNSAKAYTGEHLNTHSEDIVAYCEHLERFTFVLLMLQRAIGGRWSQCQRAGRYAVQWGKHCIIIIIINEYCYSAWSQKKTSRALNTHTHGPFSGTTRVSWYQKGKTNLDFTEARDSEWQWHQLGHMQVCTSLQTHNHASTPPLSCLQAGCPSYRLTNSVKALKAWALKST